MRFRSLLAATTVAAVALVLVAAPALAADSSTAAQTNAQAPTIPVLVDVRTAHHPGFDRITFEFRGPRPNHRIGYVSQLVEDASGKPVHLAGHAAIKVPFKVLELSSPSRIAIDIATGSSPGGTVAGGSGASGSGSSGGSGAQPPEALPFTGSQTTRLVLEGLGLLAIGLLVLTLARRTRTP